jgi:hypothetical protein
MKKNPQRHLTADVTTLDMKREYERLMQSDPEFTRKMRAAAKQSETGGGAEMMGRFVEWQKKGTEGQKELAGILCRGVLSIANNPNNSSKGAPKDAVVLDFRNRKLVERILEEPGDKVYVTYGAQHMPGVIALLRQKDPAWKVVSVKWVRGIAAPEHYEGKLSAGL